MCNVCSPRRQRAQLILAAVQRGALPMHQVYAVCVQLVLVLSKSVKLNVACTIAQNAHNEEYY